MRTEAVTKIAELARASGVLRPRDLQAHAIARQYLRLAEQQGLVVRSGRGLYVPADADVTEFHTFAEAVKRAPRGIICLLSALRFHNIGTQNPFEVDGNRGKRSSPTLRSPTNTHRPLLKAIA